MNKIPEGLVKCEVCGQYKGKVMEKNLNWENSGHKDTSENSEKYLGVSCVCEGILCRACKKNMINRPISNSYYPETNTIAHWPYFTGMSGCRKCRDEANKPAVVMDEEEVSFGRHHRQPGY